MNNLEENVKMFLDMVSVENAKSCFCKLYTGNDTIKSSIEKCKDFFILTCPGVKIEKLEITSKNWFTFDYDISLSLNNESVQTKGCCTLVSKAVDACSKEEKVDE